MLISACEKRAIKKTRAVLDSYAMRAGEKTWATPITLEGLRELRAALKRIATRQTAVACYANDGRSRMRLLWLVGSRRKFGHQGHFPSGHTRIHRKEPVPAWVRVVALLAKAGGYAHDFGKATMLFQEKLVAAEPVKDRVRHEWVSMKLLQARRGGHSVSDAWRRAFADDLPGFLRVGVACAADAIDYLVSSHHGLYGPDKADVLPDASNHVRSAYVDGTKEGPAGEIPPHAWERWQHAEARLSALAHDKPPLFWRAACMLARAALIFADHTVSARWHPGQDGALRANTGRNPKTGRVELNQELFGHLQAVGEQAGEAAYRLCNVRLPALSDEAVEQILKPSIHPRFLWQNAAVAALSALREASDAPVLVMNMAGTGSGKTRANAKCACALGRPGGIRFATALNLRSLTLQTGTAYREQLNIGTDECATIIGDQVVKKMYDAGRRLDRLNGDENDDELEFDANELDFVPPAWLEEWLEQHDRQKAILGAPVLVSTVDYLIAAGDPHRQGHHVSAMLRVADSDLILDEVDSYDPKALVAILRLVQLAAFFGRNIICSSATLALPIAEALHQAFGSGLQMRAALHEVSVSGHVVLIDNLAKPRCFGLGKPFRAEYEGHLRDMFGAMSNDSRRYAELVRFRVKKGAEKWWDGWLSMVVAGVLRMHANNAWAFADTGKRVSFGLVRIANIGTAIEVARYLAEQLPYARVACYHANDFVIQRYQKERRLDQLLTRHQGNARIESDAEIRALVEGSVPPDVPFIVVATPVEEIGRDHDFDWAVIEPSSIQSIVQVAGRVNRHRLEAKSAANIAILEANARFVRHLLAGQKKRAAFIHPGLEQDDKEGVYPTHRMCDAATTPGLLPWNDQGQLPVLDARLRFSGVDGGGCLFAELDDQSLRRNLDPFSKILFRLDSFSPQVMGEAVYRRTPLRDKNLKNVWRLDESGYKLRKVEPGGGPVFAPSDRLVTTRDRVSNDWLCWDVEELFELCDELGVGREQGMSVEITRYLRNDPDGSRSDEIVHDKSFGFVRYDRNRVRG